MYISLFSNCIIPHSVRQVLAIGFMPEIVKRISAEKLENVLRVRFIIVLRRRSHPNNRTHAQPTYTISSPSAFRAMPSKALRMIRGFLLFILSRAEYADAITICHIIMYIVIPATYNIIHRIKFAVAIPIFRSNQEVNK